MAASHGTEDVVDGGAGGGGEGGAVWLVAEDCEWVRSRPGARLKENEADRSATKMDKAARRMQR